MDPEVLAKGLFEATKRYIDARLAELPLSYMGPFEQGKEYAKGNFVTYDGQLWHCNINTQSSPGGGNPMWTLAVRGGR
jgi:hypothetical protein